MSPERIARLRAMLGIRSSDVLAVIAWGDEGWRLAAIGSGSVRPLGEPYPGPVAPATDVFLEALELSLLDGPP